MIFYSLLIIIGIVLGIISIYFYMTHLIGASIVAYLLICILITYVSNVFLKKHFKKEESGFYFLPLMLCIFVPILGVIISIFIVYSIYRLNNDFYKVTEEIDDTINLQHIKYTYEQYGAGGAFLSLMNQDEMPIVRTKALFVLAQGHLSSINPLLQDLLSDTSDEIRLLSFNILDQQESFIETDIHKIETILDTQVLDDESKAKLEKNLALLFWELNYRRLILKELETITLIKAQTYALAALKVFEHDPIIWILLGRIYTKLGQYTLADEALKIAINLNGPPSQVLPYIAEIKYKMKDYSAVQYYLNQSDTLMDITLIAPVKRFWDMK